MQLNKGKNEKNREMAARLVRGEVASIIGNRKTTEEKER
jgi:hypothetical protein